MMGHALSTRAWHWINAVAIVILFMSGLNISNAHPHLYWGNYGFDPAEAWLSVIRFPGWATIPQHYNLAVARDWHILVAWPFALGLAFIWAAMLWNGHFVRDLSTRRGDWSMAGLAASLRAHGHARGEEAQGYNPAQRILYGSVYGILLPAMVFTGLAISPGFAPIAPWLTELLGGRQSARSLHFIAAWATFAFTLLHLALALADRRLIAGMITGRRGTVAAASGEHGSQHG